MLESLCNLSILKIENNPAGDTMVLIPHLIAGDLLVQGGCAAQFYIAGLKLLVSRILKNL